MIMQLLGKLEYEQIFAGLVKRNNDTDSSCIVLPSCMICRDYVIICTVQNNLILTPTPPLHPTSPAPLPATAKRHRRTSCDVDGRHRSDRRGSHDGDTSVTGSRRPSGEHHVTVYDHGRVRSGQREYSQAWLKILPR